MYICIHCTLKLNIWNWEIVVKYLVFLKKKVIDFFDEAQSVIICTVLFLKKEGEIKRTNAITLFNISWFSWIFSDVKTKGFVKKCKIKIKLHCIH